MELRTISTARAGTGELMNDKTERLNFLKTLEEAGVHFAVHMVDGWVNLGAAEVLRYAENPDQVAAEVRGVPVDHWRAWKRWVMQHYPCYGITRRGKPCKLGTHSAEGLKDFVPGVSEYCDRHLGQSALHCNGKSVTGGV